ncbi:MAG: RagB/SusD family nutrient uptake outer membrane protein [Bacteroidales bacterium]|nr:RagB/SusD family nutrient uptake outer membrane protein [Bacteroidales bacterium]
MKKIIIPIFLGLALTAVSCSSRLDIPQKGVVPYENFYASDADCEMALANMYADFIENVAGTEGIDNPEQVILNYSADDILSAGGNPNDHDGFRVFDEFRYDYSNGTLKSCYQRYYYSIYHANLVISNFTNENRNQTEPKFTSEFTKQAVAEARVMRAYLHLMTALIWNCPPMMTRVIDGDEAATNAESQEQILNWVVEQCETAIASGKLPKRTSKTDKDNTARMNWGFAHYVAGKAAMFLGDKAKAREHLGAIIESGLYDLVPSEEYWTNFHIAGDGSCEKLFEPNFLEDPNFTNNAWGSGSPIRRGRWMVANVFCWRTDALASSPKVHQGISGWNGGAIQQDFAEKFLAHDGNGPRRLACFLTEDEWLYEMDWAGSKVNDGTLAEKKADPARGITSANGVYSHGKFFEWKHMVFVNPPKILTGDKTYPSDNVSGLGPASNQKNFNVSRYAEVLLLYAEACIGSSDAEKGKAALNAIQTRAQVPTTDLTFENVMEEKQYEMWFENCRFLDLVRWQKEGKVDMDKIMNDPKLHEHVPTVFDEFFTEGKPGYQKEHKLFTTEAPAIYSPFIKGRHEYLPFPLDFQNANPNLHDVLGWQSVK